MTGLGLGRVKTTSQVARKIDSNWTFLAHERVAGAATSILLLRAAGCVQRFHTARVTNSGRSYACRAQNSIRGDSLQSDEMEHSRCGDNKPGDPAIARNRTIEVRSRPSSRASSGPWPANTAASSRRRCSTAAPPDRARLPVGRVRGRPR
jgi:hypothetical protein